MQLSLFAAVIPIVNLMLCGGSAMDCHLNHIVPKCGQEQCCVYNSLKACCTSTPTPNECSLTEELVLQVKNITNSLTVLQTLLQETKSELKNVSNFQSEIKTLLQEVKLEQQNEKKNCDQLKNGTTSLPMELGITTINLEQNSENLTTTTATPERRELPKNCADLRVQLGGEFSGGVQTVYPNGFPNSKPVAVFCDQVTDGGGWTVIQSRSPLPIRVNFTRNWDEYLKGFGDLKGEFWIGLDNIHALTNSSQMELRIELEDWEGQRKFALYGTFHVGDAASEYVLTIGNYSGDAGDGMAYPSRKDWNLDTMKFSTLDNDNDLWLERNCAEVHKGGWWLNDCSAAHLNGRPVVRVATWFDGILWEPIHGPQYSMKNASMKIRPVSLGF